jgi:transposase
MSTKEARLDWREGQRRRAWELAQQGWKQQDIATALGVTPGAVSQWLKRAREQGVAALRRHPAPGRQPRLTPEQLARCRRCSHQDRRPTVSGARSGPAGA